MSILFSLFLDNITGTCEATIFEKIHKQPFKGAFVWWDQYYVCAEKSLLLWIQSVEVNSALNTIRNTVFYIYYFVKVWLGLTVHMRPLIYISCKNMFWLHKEMHLLLWDQEIIHGCLLDVFAPVCTVYRRTTLGLTG